MEWRLSEDATFKDWSQIGFSKIPRSLSTLFMDCELSCDGLGILLWAEIADEYFAKILMEMVIKFLEF